MKKFTTLASTCILALMASTAFSADKASAEAAITDAKAAQKAAKALRSEWRDNGKLIKQAEEALAAGKIEDAIKLASKAKFQGEMGAKQGEFAKNAGPR